MNGAQPDNIDFMPSSLVSQKGLLMTLKEAARKNIEYSSICISAHGDEGFIFDDTPPGHLLSTSDEDGIFKAICKNRWLYILACDVGADENFIDKVLGNNAKGVVAFINKPSWQSEEELKMWQAIDSIFLRCASKSPSLKVFRKARNYIIKRYEAIYPDSTQSKKRKIRRVLETIENMIIQGDHDA